MLRQMKVTRRCLESRGLRKEAVVVKAMLVWEVFPDTVAVETLECEALLQVLQGHTHCL